MKLHGKCENCQHIDSCKTCGFCTTQICEWFTPVIYDEEPGEMTNRRFEMIYGYGAVLGE